MNSCLPLMTWKHLFLALQSHYGFGRLHGRYLLLLHPPESDYIQCWTTAGPACRSTAIYGRIRQWKKTACPWETRISLALVKKRTNTYLQTESRGRESCETLSYSWYHLGCDTQPRSGCAGDLQEKQKKLFSSTFFNYLLLWWCWKW